MNIIAALNNGTTEYKDDQVIQHPPTSLAIQAAKIIQTLSATHENNVAMIMSLQLREQSNLADIEIMRQEVDLMQKEIAIYQEATRQLRIQNETNDEEHINTSL